MQQSNIHRVKRNSPTSCPQYKKNCTTYVLCPVVFKIHIIDTVIDVKPSHRTCVPLLLGQQIWDLVEFRMYSCLPACLNMRYPPPRPASATLPENHVLTFQAPIDIHFCKISVCVRVCMCECVYFE